MLYYYHCAAGFKGAAFADHLCTIKATAIWDIYCLQMLWIVLKHSLSWVTATELNYYPCCIWICFWENLIVLITALYWVSLPFYCNDILLIYAHLILAVLDICVLHIRCFYFIISVWGLVWLALGIKCVNDVSTPSQPHLFNKNVKNISWRLLSYSLICIQEVHLMCRVFYPWSIG